MCNLETKSCMCKGLSQKGEGGLAPNCILVVRVLARDMKDARSNPLLDSEEGYNLLSSSC